MKTKDTHWGKTQFLAQKLTFQAKCKQTADLPQQGKQAAELLHKNGILPQCENVIKRNSMLIQQN